MKQRSAVRRAAAARTRCSITENQIGTVGGRQVGLAGYLYGVVGGHEGEVCGLVGGEKAGDTGICGLVGDIDERTGTEGTEGAVGLVGGKT